MSYDSPKYITFIKHIEKNIILKDNIMLFFFYQAVNQ